MPVTLRNNDILTNGITATAPATVTGNWTLAAGSTWQATYADLAERYESDAVYEPGTVLVFGGEKEVTLTTTRADTSVAGVVSTNPAYILNATVGGNDTHPLIALKGRVPCKVIGLVNKGDLLVTSDKPGYAEKAQPSDNPNAVIGRAIQNKLDDNEGIVEISIV